VAKPADNALNKESIPGGPCSGVAADLVVDVTEHVPPLGVMAGFALSALEPEVALKTQHGFSLAGNMGRLSSPLGSKAKSLKSTLAQEPRYEIRW